MDDNNELVFYSSTNYKSGKYIMNRYRPLDLVVPIICGSFAFIAFFLHLIASEGSINWLYIILLVLIFVIPFILTFPLQNYQCTYMMILQKIDHITKQKVYKWGGIAHEDE